MRLQEAEYAYDRSRLAKEIAARIDLGITTMDHADIYGGGACEILFGDALSADRTLRDRIEIVGKCGIVPADEDLSWPTVKTYDLRAHHIIRSCEASLERLRTDHLDVFLLHRPSPLFQPAEAAEAMGKLLAAGKIRHVGVSNFPAHTCDLFERFLGRPLVTNQIEISLAQRQAFHDGTLDWCLANGRIPMAWSPLGGALTAGDGDLFDRLCEMADDIMMSPAALALAWVMSHPSKPIGVVGTMNLQRITNLTNAVGRAPLDQMQWFALLEAATGREVP